jgi:Xaa-Pro aminopeptidase
MRYDPADSELFVHNRSRLSAMLKPGSVGILDSNDLMPTNADGTLPWRQNSDLYYLSGIDQEESTLLLFPDADDALDREILFIKETSEHIAIWEGEKLSKQRATELSGISNIQWNCQFDLVLERLTKQAEHIYLNANEHPRADMTVQTRDVRLLKKCQQDYPAHQFERLAPLMHQLRIIKHSAEISMIQKACDITEIGFRRALNFIRPGVGEWEIEAEFIHEFIKQQSTGFAYTPIIASGKNSCILHYIKNNQRCKDGELLLMDVAAEYANWNSDMTRTVPVNGKFTERQRAVYDAVLRVLRKCNDILRPGLTPKDYQNQTINFVESELIELGLIDEAEAKQQDSSKPLVKKYFMHSTSHHLGLDVHDVCPPNEPYAAGMILTIEPGIYIPDEQIGIRLENNILIGETANLDLMANIPIEADDIEALMAKKNQ